MDSITQFVLGAGVGLAISPVKSRKIAILSGLIATLPDLDIVLNYGDDLQNMIKHRGFSHSLFVLGFSAFALAAILKKVCNKPLLSYWRWLALCLSVLISHPILDSFNIFGTQLFWPLTTPSVMIGSMFIFDIFYTLPLLISFVLLMYKQYLPNIYGLSVNTLALSFSSAYLVLALVLQAYVTNTNPPPIKSNAIINHYTMPTPSNLVIWRSVYIDDKNSYENFYNIFTGASHWNTIPHRKYDFKLDDDNNILQYDFFSHGFYRLESSDNQLVLHDIRMGTTDMPIFSFVVAQQQNEQWNSITPNARPDNYFSFKHMFGW